MLEHGGRLRAAALRFRLPVNTWLDLSTGINPHAYPAAMITPEAWHRLPEDDDDLVGVAASCYGIPDDAAILPIAGTQAAIQSLPRLITRLAAAGRPLQVALASLTYNEYAHAWRKVGHTVTGHTCAQLPEAARSADVLVLCNPNNPTGARYPVAQIRRMLDALKKQRGWLIIDEAYMDATPTESIVTAVAADDWQRLIVLRSLGKFFGLAGARAGFAIGAATVIDALRDELGPWPLSGPTRVVAARALGDRAWQAQTRGFLLDMAAQLNQLVRRRLHVVTSGSALFCWFEHARANALHDHLASRAILIRTFTARSTGGLPSVRLGLPADHQQLARLDAALETFS